MIDRRRDCLRGWQVPRRSASGPGRALRRARALCAGRLDREHGVGTLLNAGKQLFFQRLAHKESSDGADARVADFRKCLARCRMDEGCLC